MIWSRPDLIDSLTWHHIVCGLEVRITDIGSGPSMDGRQSTWRHLAPLVMATIVAPVDLLVRTNWRRFLTFAVAVVLVLMFLLYLILFLLFLFFLIFPTPMPRFIAADKAKETESDDELFQTKPQDSVVLLNSKISFICQVKSSDQLVKIEWLRNGSSMHPAR
ncbi:hypothetical protein D917_07039 [Trichinella nativa]|uniref:Ig-like domain-containing protein n=1 Tax=Trichinella nativa TaxID=6335 RepID=A0A1Y3EQ29_9BILA|nr:hypothetical protein D917_07039 [Trichinella nativa]